MRGCSVFITNVRVLSDSRSCGEEEEEGEEEGGDEEGGASIHVSFQLN